MGEAIINEGLIDILNKNKESHTLASDSNSILCIYDDTLFIWNPDSQSLLASKFINENKKHELSNRTQKLLLTNPPLFEVTNILVNQCGNLLAIWGQTGIMVMEFPRKWGPEGLFEYGKEQIICKSWNLSERFFVCNSRIYINYVKWHPCSPSQVHLIMLTSDNYLRVHDVTNPLIIHQSISLGECNPGYLTSASNTSFASCLGDSAICFDFGTPFERKETKKDVWIPIYILKGNGDVQLLYLSLKSYRSMPSFYIQGEVNMFPSVEDNYGDDACSILCLKTNPPIIVIATSTAFLHHSFALFDHSGEQGFPKLTLCVFESVELTMSLSSSRPEEAAGTSAPILLFLDPVSNSHYHCTHLAGIHTVHLPIMIELEKQIKKGNDYGALSSLFEANHSKVKHILCTLPFPGSFVSPVLGFQIYANHIGSSLIALLASWDLINLPLQLETEEFLEPIQIREPSSISNEQNFEEHIQQILKKRDKMPLLKCQYPSGVTEPTEQQCLELLQSIRGRLKSEFFDRLELAQLHLDKRVKLLISFKESQKRELNLIEDEKKIIESTFDELENKKQRIKDELGVLNEKVDVIFKRLQRHQPQLSDAEILMQADIKKIEGQLKKMTIEMKNTKNKKEFQSSKMVEVNQDLSTTEQNVLDDHQLESIHAMIKKEGDFLSQIVKRSQKFKKSFVY